MACQQEKIFLPDKDRKTVFVHELAILGISYLTSSKCLFDLSKMTEHISAPVFAAPELQEVRGTIGVMTMTTVAQAWAETGTSPLTPSHPRSVALGTPLTTQEMVPSTLTHLRWTVPVQTHLLAAGKWHWRRHSSWYKMEPLLPQKCQEAFCCWWCGHKTCPLVLLVSYFFATIIPILLSSSSFQQQCFRLTPKHAVRVIKN